MPSISSMLELITDLQSSALEVHAERCVLVRNSNADCLKCASVCAGGCISYDGEDLIIDTDQCIGCGTCASACPTCAIEARNPVDAQLLNEALAAKQYGEGEVAIACANVCAQAGAQLDPDAVAHVECLGRVEESLVCALFASGATKVSLVCGDCSECAHTSGFEWACNVVETCKLLLDTWQVEGEVRITHKLPNYARAKDEGFDKTKRRAIKETYDTGKSVGFSAMSKMLTPDAEGDSSAVLSKFPKVGDDGTLAHFVPDRRETLLNALAMIGQPKDEMIECRLWGHVIIDTEKCTSCRMCAVFCPTGALRKVDGEVFGVDHFPGECVKCETCKNICPAGALEISDAVFAREMLAGKTDTYVMEKPAIKRSSAHTIWELAKKNMFSIEEVYER